MSLRLTPPPGRPDERAQDLIDAIAAYCTDPTIDPLERALGARHIAYRADDTIGETAHYCRRAGITWQRLVDQLQMSMETIQSREKRHRRETAA